MYYWDAQNDASAATLPRMACVKWLAQQQALGKPFYSKNTDSGGGLNSRRRVLDYQAEICLPDILSGPIVPVTNRNLAPLAANTIVVPNTIVVQFDGNMPQVVHPLSATRMSTPRG
eukprot:CAMPEP_0117462084 /NCGR_PEP_ID=MMETSP0784-20121206/2868_1 /TAXON_ID=39447 /ORGANISM="" /LENGTH=115 /DNA_ID=CAMNT_0005255831 /DNA_START=63 /DNA_END=408 /DNA_ORIENTATION=-